MLRIAGVCVLASMTQSMDATVVSVAQRTFVTAFGSTQAFVAWTMTAYMLAMATVTPLAGWASDRFGTKRVFMGSVLAFNVGSFLCALAPNMMLLIVFRVVQGLGGGFLIPLVLTIFTREAGPGRLGRLMAVLGIPMVLGPICGPVLGGWLIDSFGWEWTFWINLPNGLTTLILAAIVLPNDRPKASEPFDFVGMLLLSPGLAMFLYGVSSIPDRGTMANSHVWVPAVIGLLLIIGFVVHALYRTKHPLIDLRLFTNRVLRLAISVMFIYGVGYAGVGLLFPSYFQELLNHTSVQAGMDMVVMGLGAMLAIPFAGMIVDRRGPGTIVVVGCSVITGGMALFAFGVAVYPHYLPTLLVALGIIGMGAGCTGLPLSAAAVQTLARHQLATGSTLLSVGQQLAASIGAALMSVILTSQFNRSENISGAHKIAALQEECARRGVPIDPSRLPRAARNPDFAGNLLHDLSHAYSVVFFVAVGLMASMWIPAVMLARATKARSGRD
nr:DHA2 family efflux MFS transporter permease subunit [Mycobacterium simulans]